jgi:Tfp pilus assembly protein PilW
MMRGQRDREVRRRATGGYSLVEVMVASTITGMIVATMLSFYITNYRIGFVNQERNRINADMRRFTGQLIRDGREANYFVLYNSIQSSARDKAEDRQLDGNSGDLLVFVSTEETTSITEPILIKGYVAYYRAEGADSQDGLAPVRRYETTFENPVAGPIENVLPNEAGFLTGDRVVELSRGLADGRLFYNFWGRSIMVNGQIHHGNDAKRVTETYNFTVSPRG